MRSRTQKVVSGVGMALVVALFMFPFLWMLATSLMPSDQVLGAGFGDLGREWRWENYSEVFSSVPFMQFVLNGLLVSVLGVALSVVVSVLSAYAFSRLTFKYRDKLFLIFIGTLVLPQEVLIIPLYIMMQRANLVNTYTALIVPFAFGAFGAFLLRQFMLQIPRELEEAAEIDGASRFSILVRVLIPQIKAPLAVISMFIFIDYWGNFLWPLIVVNDAALATIPLGLSMFSGERGTDWGPLMAATTLSVLPSLIVVIAMQRFIQRGVNVGAFGGR